MDNQGTVDVPSNISINGREFSIDEAQQLIDLGNKTREAEQKWNTSLDRVWPEYGRLSQEKNQWQTEKQKYEQQLAQFQQKQNAGVETSTDVAQARKAAKALGLVLDEDLQSGGFIKKDDLESWYTERRTKERDQEQAIEAINKEADKLASEINSSDAPAKFNKKAVLAYAAAYGHTDLRKAYEEMNEDVLKPWKEAQIESAKKPGLKTLKPSGQKQPEEKRPKNDDEWKALLRETLNGSSEGQ